MKNVDNRKLSWVNVVASLARGRALRLMVWALGALTLGAGPVRGDDSDTSQSDANLISNGDFSEATIPVYGGAYGGGADITVPSWEFGRSAGLAKGSSAWIQTTHSDPYAAYMQRELTTTYIQQTFTAPEAGRYRFSFWYKARDVAATATGYQLSVSMDGVKFKGVTTVSTSWAHATVDIELTEGEHVLKFYGEGQYEEQSTDISVIIDDISLRKITASDDLISNGDFSDVAISSSSDGGTSWGVGPANASAQSWEIGANAGITKGNTTWRSTIYSEPYAALIHNELTSSTLAQTIYVPEDGTYRFSFWYTARDGYQVGLQLAVSMDSERFAGVTTSDFDWQQCTADIELTAGSHELKFYGARGYSSSSEQKEGDCTILIDDVSLVRLSDVRSAVWTGQGDTGNAFGDAANWQCYDQNGNLLEGKLPDAQTSEVSLLADADWRGVPASSLMMTSLNLDGHHLQITGDGTLGAVIDVKSGVNCVANGDFSDVEIPADVNNGAWGKSESITVSSWVLASNAGVTKQSSDWTVTVFSLLYSAFIQGERDSVAAISQTLTVPSDGRYRLTFWYKGRDVHVYTLGYELAAAVDGNLLTVATTTSYNTWMSCSADVDLEAGEHELKFYGKGQWTEAIVDRSVIIDDVSLYKIAGSRLTVEVPEGVVFDNSRLKLEGALTFVKKGAGKLAASAGLQTYDGGTLVEEGVLRLNALGSKIPLGATGEASPVYIAAGATLDLNGYYEMDRYHIVLDGGTIANYGNDLCSANEIWRGAFHFAKLTADSHLDATGNFLIHGGSGKAIDLGGHTLTAKLADGKTLFVGNVITNGTVRFESANAIFYACDGFLATDVDFDIAGKLAIHAPIQVRNWTVRSDVEAGLSDATVSVGGVFTPVADYFCDTQLADGATLDLSGRDTALDVKSLDTANDKDYRLSFADNAIIEVYFGDWRASGKVIAWTADTKPANLGTLKFTVSPLNKYRRRLLVEDDGIYAVTPEGMMIILR